VFEKLIEVVTNTGGYTPKQLKRFLLNITIVFVVVAILFFIVLYLAIKLFGLTVHEGKWSIGEKIQQETPVVVSSTTGWQDSGIYVKKEGVKFSFRASGRICTALEHLLNLTKIIKPYVATQLTPEEKNLWGDQRVFLKYPTPPIFADDKPFSRNFIGPDGEEAESDLFFHCKLDNRFKAGALLGIIIPGEVRDQDDPLKVLWSNPNLEVFNVTDYGEGNPYTSKTVGRLAFVVNEVVLSPFSEDPKARKAYEILQRLNSTDERHKLRTELIPLVYYSDNIGSFRVIVKESDQ